MRRRVLVDEFLPIQLHRWLSEFDVRTVAFMGWKGKRNSELLAAADRNFEVLLTNDRFLAREHDLRRHEIGVVVLTTNRLREVEELVPGYRRGARPGSARRDDRGPAGATLMSRLTAYRSWAHKLNLTDTRPSTPKSPVAVWPGSRITRPVVLPVVTIWPAGSVRPRAV
jgi:predicted nuclease of predicted toxin-antitoxin system